MNDGGKTGTEAAGFRDYNFTIKQTNCRYKSIIVIGSMSINLRCFLDHTDIAGET